MPIFGVNRGRLAEKSEVPIEKEKDIQNLTEDNLSAVSGIEFVTSEFELNELCIDTLGFDKESRSFVVIEYKRKKNFSVIDQSYAYLRCS